RYGEQTERAIITIASMSGNMGIKGGGITHGGRHSSLGVRFQNLPYGRFRPARSIKAENWAKYILDGSLQPPIKMAYIVATNAINRSSNVNDNIKALGQLEYIVVQDQVMTPTARYADMVIPVCTDLERADIVRNRGEVFYNRQALNPAGESRTDYWVFSKLAERLGFGEAYTGGKTQEEWLEYFLKSADLDENSLKANGSIQNKGDEKPGLAQFRLDPVNHPLRTLSGLIQILCPQAEKYGLPIIPAYIESKPKESVVYPLQLITPHSKLRANSAVYPNPWLQKLEPHTVWINPADAKERGINDGDMVEVFNQYGALALKAKLTQRIMPGVVCIYQGVWYKPDKDGVDQGGCPNTLTGHDLSPTGGMAVHSEWVQIRSKSRE
ncbi:hypothetical protein FJZ33_11215, partial [Candidatus Poribacteria bacterium]|nr:hypothetical protein [Candidatus Poribacteria bacterium]